VYRVAKVGAEWCVAAILLTGLSPLLLVLAVMVKLTSDGPAFYAQTRLGRGGRVYRMFKLRTMMHNAESVTGPVWAAKDDPRVTRFGRFLRDTHLDELPQLWNVLCGHMGLIGPRPERPEIVARLERQIPNYRDRLLVRPGVTGLAQMVLPADSDLEGVRKKLAHDLYYVRRMSLLMDARLAACTTFYFIGALCKGVCQLSVGRYSREVQEAPFTLDLDLPMDGSRRAAQSAIA
jgi:lipopolysaccharide/colanic/teichoic acid biosynthesis glycosyltransferase